MNVKQQRNIPPSIFLIMGIALILGAPFLLDIFYSVITNYDFRYHSLRFEGIIPSFQVGGIMLIIWGVVNLIIEETRKK